MTKAVLFDLDGTFADTAPDLAAALNHVRATRSLPPLPLDTLRPQASHGSIGLLRVGMNVTPESPDFQTLRDVFLGYYAENICVETRLFDGISELVEELEYREISWGIVTNKPHRFTVPLMEALGYAGRASCMISGDTCAHAKPHPAPLLEASNILDIRPDQCIYLGDDLRDIQAANAADMAGIIANYGYVGPDASVASWRAQGLINNPMELIAYLSL